MAGKKWSEDAKRKWGERCRKQYERLRAIGTGGNIPFVAVASGGNNRGGPRDPGDGNDVGNGSVENNDGCNLLDENADQPKKETQHLLKETPTDQPVIDLTVIKPAVPGYLIEYNEFLDDIAQGITSKKSFRRLYYVKELTPEKAKAEAEMLWPLFERLAPKFFQNHPIAAGVLVILLRPIMRLRSKLKQLEEVKNGTENPAEKS